MIAANRASTLLPTTTRRRGLAGCALMIVGTLACSGLGDESDPAKQARAEEFAVRRFALIQERVAAAKVQADEAGFPQKIAATPIFKYSDPARGYVAAAVWKLGDEGRPKALLATELDRKDHGKPCIAYEYVSLTTTPFSLTSDDMDWAPAGTLYEFRPIPNAPAPLDTPQRRLRQLREIAKRFTSRELVKTEKCELRLLPTPVDRYTPSKADKADGAIFFFTFGTNPEVVLLIESDGKAWHYAAGRLTGAQEVILYLDDSVVWKGAPLHESRDSPFTGSVTPIAIPGIAADGREIDN